MNKHFASAALHRENPLPGPIEVLLHSRGLRATDQRISLANLLLRAPGHRVSAESLYDEAHRRRCAVSRATVCRTLREFEDAGLLTRSRIDGSRKAWFAIDHRLSSLELNPGQ
jgi:Fe2+ or Zn2+ uptake regulation protein